MGLAILLNTQHYTTSAMKIESLIWFSLAKNKKSNNYTRKIGKQNPPGSHSPVQVALPSPMQYLPGSHGKHWSALDSMEALP